MAFRRCLFDSIFDTVMLARCVRIVLRMDSRVYLYDLQPENTISGVCPTQEILTIGKSFSSTRSRSTMPFSGSRRLSARSTSSFWPFSHIITGENTTIHSTRFFATPPTPSDSNQQSTSFKLLLGPMRSPREKCSVEQGCAKVIFSRTMFRKHP